MIHFRRTLTDFGAECRIGRGPIADDPGLVTCGRCQRTHNFKVALLCQAVDGVVAAASKAQKSGARSPCKAGVFWAVVTPSLYVYVSLFETRAKARTGHAADIRAVLLVDLDTPSGTPRVYRRISPGIWNRIEPETSAA